MKRSRPYFEERQHFDQWWLKLIIIVSTLVSLGPFYYGTIVQFTTGKPWGDKPMSNTGLIVMDSSMTLLMAVIIYFIFYTKLITKINSEGIHLQFRPLLLRYKLIPREQIESFEVRKYNPIKKYGGWGIKYGKRGRAFNISGNIGLQLTLKDGKKLLIGTKRPEAIKRAMHKLMNKYE